MDGFEFVNWIRLNESFRDIPVIAVTARDLSLVDRARLNGAVAMIIDKQAYDPEQMLREVSDLLHANIRARRK
jgi:CheY-like chemotaxis protein